MRTEDVYLLALHEPYQQPGHAYPINATIVHAKTLLHVAIAQPDGGLMYRCLTEFPNRRAGSVVPLSTLTYELDGGKLWSQIGDWEQVVACVVHLSRTQQCDAMPLGLPEVAAALLSSGPTTTLHLSLPGGRRSEIGSAERQAQLEEITGYVRRFAHEGAFWPGDDLTAAPDQPAVLPYHPYRSRG